MTMRSKAISQGKETLEKFRELLDIIESDLNNNNVQDETDALIAIKAIDSFFKEENGLAHWSEVVKNLIIQQMGKGYDA